ncbi:MAG: hypothetical protein LBV80_04695 [Deltaproteobacteria bacterium]|jgi:hypothetical protein|nr:hypothetical protein [Deltaproteobacteria bacterium]
MLSWNEAFTQGNISWKNEWQLRDQLVLPDIASLKKYLDLAHIRYCLLKPYFENSAYPLVETRELLPSFEPDLWEYKKLPGFSMVAFGRPINYFHEVFQFDLMPSITADLDELEAASLMGRNLQTLQNRLHKSAHESLINNLGRSDVGNLNNYAALTPFLTMMDRAQVLSLDGKTASGQKTFRLSGIFASFPSDLDTEIKRFGLRIGKFAVGDNELYDLNRLFVYQFLMELYGFPISSERRTSAALFSRRLHKMGEKFLVRALGQSDRTITTLWSSASGHAYPALEKIALVALDADQTDLLPLLKEDGYFVNPKKRVLILRIKYKQHKFNPDNVRQDRALSVESQEIIHPITGEALTGVNIIKDTSNMFLRLNDIVRGEYTGYIVYKRSELIENTETDEKKLKFLFAWLSKHQRRIIGYSDEFFSNVAKVLDTYLIAPENYETFNNLRDLYQEVVNKFSYIQQARKVRILEDLRTRQYKGKHVTYAVMLEEAVELLHTLKFEIVTYFDSLVLNVIKTGEAILSDRYLIRTYIEKKDLDRTPRRQDIKKNYGRLVSLIDEFKAIRKARMDKAPATLNTGAFELNQLPDKTPAAPPTTIDTGNNDSNTANSARQVAL